SPAFKVRVATFLDGLVSHYVLDDGKLVVAHAGMKETMQGRGSSAVRSFALYGETTEETDEFGLPMRYNWAAEYRGQAMVVYGHTPVPEPEWLNRTVRIDTGCVFGGKVNALRYPEKEFVSVPAPRTYYDSVKPFRPYEERHMGWRAVLVVCRDEEAARKRFGVVNEGAGICYTRTGRCFFEEPAPEADLLTARVSAAMDRAGLWEELCTDWACLDCELMP